MREPAHDCTLEADWDKLRPMLDAAMHGLKESDREAVLLRYFENRSYAESAPHSALMKMPRACAWNALWRKLRAVLTKRAITTTASLASIISANAVQVAPPALAAALTNTSLAAAVREPHLHCLNL